MTGTTTHLGVRPRALEKDKLKAVRRHPAATVTKIRRRR